MKFSYGVPGSLETKNKIATGYVNKEHFSLSHTKWGALRLTQHGDFRILTAHSAAAGTAWRAAEEERTPSLD